MLALVIGGLSSRAIVQPSKGGWGCIGKEEATLKFGKASQPGISMELGPELFNWVSSSLRWHLAPQVEKAFGCSETMHGGAG